LCTTCQQCRQLGALLGAEPTWRTCRLAIAQRLFATGSTTGNPLADGPLGYPEGFGDGQLLPALLVKRSSAKPPSFAPVGWWLQCAHGPMIPPGRVSIRSLCRGQ
jgi:hypothetical protein